MSATIEYVMTGSPLTIGADQTVTTAIEMMTEFGVRHLPVRNDGEVVGLLTLADLENASPTLAVEAVMRRNVLTVDPEDSAADVIARMADTRAEAAVAVVGKRVVGIFTPTDAERLLAAILEAPAVS